MTPGELSNLYAVENLTAPAVLPWPLQGAAEERRRVREAAFAGNLGLNPPPGLDWIRSHAEAKYRPDRVVEGCRAVLVSALGYFRSDETDLLPLHESADAPAGGRVARYARGRDYHREFGHRLRRIARSLESALSGHRFRSFTDIGPLDETWLAEESGLGFTGRHTLSILPESGSWVVLGHIAGTFPFEAHPGRRSPLSCPEGCRRCIDACPTGALSLPGRMDASRCISYLTIEHSGVVDTTLAENFGDRIFGCDACQEACPFNYRVKTTGVQGFLRDIAGSSLQLSEVLKLANHRDMTDRFAGSPLMRAGRNALVRNACIAAGNSGDAALIPLLEGLVEDTDTAVGAHAARAIRQIRSEG